MSVDDVLKFIMSDAPYASLFAIMAWVVLMVMRFYREQQDLIARCEKWRDCDDDEQ
jgi:hypothetical protein